MGHSLRIHFFLYRHCNGGHNELHGKQINFAVYNLFNSHIKGEKDRKLGLNYDMGMILAQYFGFEANYLYFDELYGLPNGDELTAGAVSNVI